MFNIKSTHKYNCCQYSWHFQGTVMSIWETRDVQEMFFILQLFIYL